MPVWSPVRAIRGSEQASCRRGAAADGVGAALGPAPAVPGAPAAVPRTRVPRRQHSAACASAGRAALWCFLPLQSLSKCFALCVLS